MFLDKLFAATPLPSRQWDADPGASGWVNSDAGEWVSDQTAMKLSAVWLCVAIISGDIKSLPWGVYEKQDGKRIRRSDHPVDQLLSLEPNPEMDSTTFRETMQIQRELKGNAYAEIQRDYLGDPKALWILDADQVQIKRTVQGALYYEYRQSGKTRQIKPENVLHIKGMSMDGIVGMSVLQYARETIGAGLAIAKTGNTLFANGLRPSAVFTHPNKLEEKARANLRASIAKLYQGSANTGRPILLEEGMKVEKWSITPEEAQFLQSREFNIQDIARWFGVKAYKLGILQRETHTNIYQNAKEHVEGCIMPRCMSWEMEAKRKLFRPEERGKLYTKFDFRGLLRDAPTERADYYRKMADMGAYSINDILEKEDEDPLPAELGDIRLVPLNYEPLRNKLKPRDEKNHKANREQTNQNPEEP
ncbi:MAG: phage portal protein [Chlorobiaceae bacterium]|nr:phage portal protein [Chlorobiaceae bacterium]